MVLFPLPTSTKVKPRLARELRQVVENSEHLQRMISQPEDSVPSPLTDLFIWILTMGGIAASFTVHRSFFEIRLRSMIRRRSADQSSEWTWPAFKMLVSRFLWWDPVVDRPAMGLWLKVTTDELHMADSGTDIRGAG